MIGVTIGIGDKYLEYAYRAALAFKAHTGLDSYIITDNEFNQYLSEIESQDIKWFNEKTWYLKFKIFDLLSEVSNYVYFDSDWNCINEWNPLEYADRSEFICVKDRVWNADVMAQAKKLGIPEKEYFNGGFYIVNRQNHYELMQHCCKIYKEVPKQWGEQCVINKAVYELGIKKHYLSKRFNWMDFEQGEKYPGVIAVHGSINYEVYNLTKRLDIFNDIK